MELPDTGVKVQIVCPGIVKTEFHTRQNIDLSDRPRLDPEEVVVRIITEDGQLLRAVTLEPKRDYYGLGGRWPLHNVLQQAYTMS